jgi:hypothetical protein
MLEMSNRIIPLPTHFDCFYFEQTDTNLTSENVLWLSRRTVSELNCYDVRLIVDTSSP